MLVIVSLPVPSVGIFELSMVEDIAGGESWGGGEKMGEGPDQGNPAGGFSTCDINPSTLCPSQPSLIFSMWIHFYFCPSFVFPNMHWTLRFKAPVGMWSIDGNGSAGTALESCFQTYYVHLYSFMIILANLTFCKVFGHSVLFSHRESLSKVTQYRAGTRSGAGPGLVDSHFRLEKG
jgi:hypothetical protein